MEQVPSNMPVMDEPKPGIAGWFQVWMKAVTKPNEQTYIELADSPEATSKTAFIWIFIAGTLSGVFQAILRAIYVAVGNTPRLPIPGLEKYLQNLPNGGQGSIGSALLAICCAPIVGVLTVLFFALITAIVQWIAKMFGGTGTFDKLAYVYAAISVPFALVFGVLSLLTAIPYVGACFGIISFALAIYSIVLRVMAVKGVNRFGWGPALGAVFIPALVIGLFCCCLTAAGAALLGPVIKQNFNNFQQFAP